MILLVMHDSIIFASIQWWFTLLMAKPFSAWASTASYPLNDANFEH
jgi:hypothetical protein